MPEKVYKVGNCRFDVTVGKMYFTSGPNLVAGIKNYRYVVTGA